MEIDAKMVRAASCAQVEIDEIRSRMKALWAGIRSVLMGATFEGGTHHPTGGFFFCLDPKGGIPSDEVQVGIHGAEKKRADEKRVAYIATVCVPFYKKDTKVPPFRIIYRTFRKEDGHDLGPNLSTVGDLEGTFDTLPVPILLDIDAQMAAILRVLVSHVPAVGTRLRALAAFSNKDD